MLKIEKKDLDNILSTALLEWKNLPSPLYLSKERVDEKATQIAIMKSLIMFLNSKGALKEDVNFNLDFPIYDTNDDIG